MPRAAGDATLVGCVAWVRERPLIFRIIADICRFLSLEYKRGLRAYQQSTGDFWRSPRLISAGSLGPFQGLPGSLSDGLLSVPHSTSCVGPISSLSSLEIFDLIGASTFSSLRFPRCLFHSQALTLPSSSRPPARFATSPSPQLAPLFCTLQSR